MNLKPKPLFVPAPGRKGRVRIAPAYLPDLVALVGTWIDQCLEANDRFTVTANRPGQNPEIAAQARANREYYRHAKAFLDGAVARLGYSISAHTLEAARLAMADDLLQVQQSIRTRGQKGEPEGES